jgi:hypothetical protein
MRRGLVELADFLGDVFLILGNVIIDDSPLFSLTIVSEEALASDAGASQHTVHSDAHFLSLGRTLRAGCLCFV